MFSKIRENVECNFEQRQHVHCAEGNVKPAGRGKCKHIHCFETVTGEAIPFGNNHVHHVEYVTSVEDCHDGHKHCVLIATTIEQPVRC